MRLTVLIRSFGEARNERPDLSSRLRLRETHREGSPCRRTPPEDVHASRALQRRLDLGSLLGFGSLEMLRHFDSLTFTVEPRSGRYDELVFSLDGFTCAQDSCPGRNGEQQKKDEK